MIERKPIGVEAPYRNNMYENKNVLLERIKQLEAIVVKLEQRIIKLEKI